jgi:RNA-dependent RNA polymerase
MNDQELAKLRACAHKLRLLAEEDPQINLIARGPRQWKLIKLEPEQQGVMFNPPDLSKVRFRTRTLIEGLIGLGTLKPGDVPDLLKALQQHAVAPAFQEKLLESMFMLKEDRVRDVARMVDR